VNRTDKQQRECALQVWRLADETKKETVTLEELMASNLAMTDATVKLLIEKGVFTEAEFKAKLDTERANYLAVRKRLH
jgi:hypothetical protein